MVTLSHLAQSSFQQLGFAAYFARRHNREFRATFLALSAFAVAPSRRRAAHSTVVARCAPHPRNSRVNTILNPRIRTRSSFRCGCLRHVERMPPYSSVFLFLSVYSIKTHRGIPRRQPLLHPPPSHPSTGSDGSCARSSYITPLHN